MEFQWENFRFLFHGAVGAALLWWGLPIAREWVESQVVRELPLARGRGRVEALGVWFGVWGTTLSLSLLFGGPLLWGILGGVMGWGAAWGWLCYRRHQLLKEIQWEALSLLHSIQGFLASGESLSKALFAVSQTASGPFSVLLHRALLPFRQGRSLGSCLQSLSRELPLVGPVGVFPLVGSLEQTGVDVLPLVASNCRHFQRWWDLHERQRGARNSILGQWGLSTLIPWVLLGALNFFQPSLLRAFWGGLGLWVVGLVGAWQLASAYFLWNWVRFE